MDHPIGPPYILSPEYTPKVNSPRRPPNTPRSPLWARFHTPYSTHHTDYMYRFFIASMIIAYIHAHTNTTLWAEPWAELARWDILYIHYTQFVCNVHIVYSSTHFPRKGFLPRPYKNMEESRNRLAVAHWCGGGGKSDFLHNAIAARIALIIAHMTYYVWCVSLCVCVCYCVCLYDD